MKLLASSALLASAAGWVLLVLTFMTLLSGSLETRSCGTECVKQYYFGATGLGVAALLAAVLALFPAGSRKLGAFSFVIAFPLVAITIALFVIGEYGHLLY
jgi:hypothetical protein